MNDSGRSLKFAWFILAGIPSYIWCFATHICQCGHLAHNPNPRAAGYYDLIFMACFVAGSVATVRSDMRRRLLCLTLIVFLLISRMLLDSGGGALICFETPALVFLAVYAVFIIHRVQRQRNQAGAASTQLSVVQTAG